MAERSGDSLQNCLMLVRVQSATPFMIYGGCRQVVKTIGCDPIIVGSIPTSHPNLEGKVDRVHICLLNKMFFLEECVSNTLPSAIFAPVV